MSRSRGRCGSCWWSGRCVVPHCVHHIASSTVVITAIIINIGIVVILVVVHVVVAVVGIVGVVGVVIIMIVVVVTGIIIVIVIVVVVIIVIDIVIVTMEYHYEEDTRPTTMPRCQCRCR